MNPSFLLSTQNQKNRSPSCACTREILPEVYLRNDDLFRSALQRKLRAIRLIVRVLDQDEKRVSPALHAESGRIDWTRIDAQVWNEAEQMAIQWMKTIWTEELHVVSDEINWIWPSDYKLCQAVIAALAVDSYNSSLLASSCLKQLEMSSRQNMSKKASA